MRPTNLDTIKILEGLLEKLNYKSKEPFMPGSKVLIFESGTFLSATFVKYQGKCRGNNNTLCAKCKGAMEFEDILYPEHTTPIYVSRCNVASWPGSRRRVFLADDPIIDLIKIHFNF